ncbi:hypothetical protein [Actinospongicola halichondriae]|uniref:hypothetical protein n=1 Tax=Actinospongicola halichondriae TaxID=3236844 RepID=UPI003D3ED783
MVLVQLLVILAGDSRVFSGSDAGGRAAAIGAAVGSSGCDHDLGYWAEEWDPAGEAHPMFNTVAVGERFVQPTAMPYVCAAATLERGFGRPASLVVSIVGVLLAATGAWMLERESGSSGLLSFVTVGVVGPVAFYGSDTWEHAPAVGCALFGTALILSRSGRLSGAVAGVLWGLAVSMRVETAIVGLGLAAGVLLVVEMRKSVLADRWRVAIAGVAAVLVLAVDRTAQQRIIGSDYRGGRASTQAGNILGEVGDRTRDAVVTTFGLLPTDSDLESILLGVVFVLALLVVGAAITGSEIETRLVHGFALIAALIACLRILDPGFVPGMLAASPIAAVGVFSLRWRSGPPVGRVLAIGAVSSLPIVWALQWTGNLGPQWGGRYVLLSGALLATCGATLVRSGPSRLGHVVVALTVAIGSMGLLWHSQRTQLIGVVLDDLLTTPCEEVLVSTSPFLLREGGAIEEFSSGVRADGCRLLSSTVDDVAFALGVAADSGARRSTVLLPRRIDDPARVLGAVTVLSRSEVDLHGLRYSAVVVAL